MSTTVGFGFTSTDDSFQEVVVDILQEADMGVAFGFHEFEADVRDGVESLAEAFELDVLMAIRSPRGLAANLAPEIDQDLTRYELEGVSPLFFEMLRRIQSRMQEMGVVKFFIFFASEWEKDEEVRYGYGSVEDLVDVLSAPGHWYMRLMDLKTRRQWNSDRYPYVFELQVQ